MKRVDEGSQSKMSIKKDISCKKDVSYKKDINYKKDRQS